MIRTAGAPLSMASAVRAAIAQLDPSLPVAGVRTMEDVVAQSQSRPRFLSVLLTFFTTVALALAAIGVYGVISYSVERRTAEFGIRMAIGADSGRILRMVLRQGALLGAAGVAIGVGSADMADALHEEHPLRDPAAGCADLRGHGPAAIRTDAGGELDSGAPGNADRSDRGAALRLIRT